MNCCATDCADPACNGICCIRHMDAIALKGGIVMWPLITRVGTRTRGAARDMWRHYFSIMAAMTERLDVEAEQSALVDFMRSRTALVPFAFESPEQYFMRFTDRMIVHRIQELTAINQRYSVDMIQVMHEVDVYLINPGGPEYKEETTPDDLDA